MLALQQSTHRCGPITTSAVAVQGQRVASRVPARVGAAVSAARRMSVVCADGVRETDPKKRVVITGVRESPVLVCLFIQ